MKIVLSFDADSDEGRYLKSCARIRGLAVASLSRRILGKVMQDKLVLAILDDDSKRYRERGDHKYRERN